MTRHLPFYSAFLLLGLTMLCASCGNGSTAPTTAPTTSQSQTPQQAGQQAAAQAKAQAEAAAQGAAAQKQAGGVH